MSTMVSPQEIEEARTPAGGWTKQQLAAWGVEWPPAKGWKDDLVRRFLDGGGELPKPAVRHQCSRCRSSRELYHPIPAHGGVVSPAGIEHFGKDGGTTLCGVDATGPGWWWAL